MTACIVVAAVACTS